MSNMSARFNFFFNVDYCLCTPSGTALKEGGIEDEGGRAGEETGDRMHRAIAMRTQYCV